MGQTIELTASDGARIAGYRADPEGPAKGGVVVIQEIFGLNHHIRAVCDRFAAQGYLAVAPAMQDRWAPGFEVNDYGPEQFAKSRAFFGNFRPEQGLADVAAAVEVAKEAGKVGITGYCFGGMVTWRAAHAGLGLAAASGFYGGGIPNYIDLAPTIPIEMHFGDRDTGIPLEQIEQLRARYPQVPVYLYPAGHGFFNDERQSSYDAASAATAWQRTLDFFAQHLQ
ncbi:dienelactone hydrolase family protein [Devosia sp. 1566]|uniref:dienelactone hydrolase family protein n=1 Tax=unclassified Devosia TaxID=196773 RepID=UPI000FD7F316|nr:dienelactone hydrolase family protein [Devosia sp. 1566]